MKVLFVTENLGSGGAERQLTGLASMMARDGIECTVVTWIDKKFYADTLDQAGVKRILLQPKSRFDRVIKLASIYRRVRPDAVIAFLPMANETALLASLLFPVKVIVSERSFTVNWGVRRKITGLLYLRAYRIVANSCNESKNLQQHMPDLADRILAIPNYVDCTMFRPKPKQNCTDDTLHLIGVGRVIPSKNILNLLVALADLRQKGYNFDFKWYGATYNKEYLEKVNQSISTLALADCFTLMGECHDMPVAYDAADAFVMPSLHEGYPNVLVEAMASQLPVAVSAVCEHPYIISEGVHGFLFNPSDTHSLTAAIEKLLLLSQAQRDNIGKTNRRKVLTDNSIETFKERYLELI